MAACGNNLFCHVLIRRYAAFPSMVNRKSSAYRAIWQGRDSDTRSPENESGKIPLLYPAIKASSALCDYFNHQTIYQFMDFSQSATSPIRTVIFRLTWTTPLTGISGSADFTVLHFSNLVK